MAADLPSPAPRCRPQPRLHRQGVANGARDRFAGFSREECEALLAFVNAI